MSTEHDPGDEHADPAPRPLSKIDALLAEWGDVPRLDSVSNYWDVLDIAHSADYMRMCCAACARESRGEDDGS